MKIIVSVLFFFLIWGMSTSAQESNYDSRVEELRNELGYKTKKKRAIRLRDNIKKEIEEQIEEAENAEESDITVPPGVAEFFKFIGYLLIFILVGVIIYFLIHLIRPQFIKNLKVPEAEDLPNIEEIEDINDLNIESLLEAALRKGDYRSAIRALFLENLRFLNTQDSIKWQKHKTNRDYLRESRGQQFYQSFMNMINKYERIWYGNHDIDAATYEALAPYFENNLLTPKLDYEH